MWSSQWWLRLKQSQIKLEKCFRGLNGIRTRGFCFSAAVLHCSSTAGWWSTAALTQRPRLTFDSHLKTALCKGWWNVEDKHLNALREILDWIRSLKWRIQQSTITVINIPIQIRLNSYSFTQRFIIKQYLRKRKHFPCFYRVIETRLSISTRIFLELFSKRTYKVGYKVTRTTFNSLNYLSKTERQIQTSYKICMAIRIQ